MPVTVVESVKTGAVVGKATVPASPFAEATETLVTVPPPVLEVMVIVEPEGVRVIPVPAAKVIAPVRLLRLVTPEDAPPPIKG